MHYDVRSPLVLQHTHSMTIASPDETWSNAKVVTKAEIAGLQRRRREQGQFGLVRAETPVLLWAAQGRRNRMCFDLARSLRVLPLAYVALNVPAVVECAKSEGEGP